MKFTRFIFVAILGVVMAFLFGNIDGAIAGKSNIERSSSIEKNIFEHTGMYINLN